MASRPGLRAEDQPGRRPTIVPDVLLASLFFFSRVSMRRAEQPRAVSLDRIEEQHEVGTRNA